MVPAYLNERATGGAVASPFEGGLGGSAPLLIRFLGASEKMNRKYLLLLFKKKRGGIPPLLIEVDAHFVGIDHGVVVFHGDFSSPTLMP